MNETEDEERLSNCCGAHALGEIHDGEGMCAKCRDHAAFMTEAEEAAWMKTP